MEKIQSLAIVILPAQHNLGISRYRELSYRIMGCARGAKHSWWIPGAEAAMKGWSWGPEMVMKNGDLMMI